MTIGYPAIANEFRELECKVYRINLTSGYRCESLCGQEQCIKVVRLQSRIDASGSAQIYIEGECIKESLIKPIGFLRSDQSAVYQ